MKTIKYIFALGLITLIHSCVPNKIDLSDCIDISLQEKLNTFEQELYDSLSPQKIIFDRLILKAIEKEKIQLDYIKFTDSEIKNLKLCVAKIKNNKLTDTTKISGDNYSICSDFRYHIKNSLLNNIHTMDKNVILFWLYKYLDKTFFYATIKVDIINGEEIIVINNKRVKQISSIRTIFKDLKSNFNKKKIEHSSIKLMANMDNVYMDLIDKIEFELRESNALKLTYSTLKNNELNGFSHK